MSPPRTSLGLQVAPQGPRMTTMKPEIISPEPHVISLKAQEVPNRLFEDRSTPLEIPIDLSGILNYLSLTLSDDPE